MSLKEKVSYLKGLAEGFDIGIESKEGKLITTIIDTLALMADEIEELAENALDIGDELDALSDDLADVEEYVFDEFEDDDDLFYDDDDDDLFDDEEEHGCHSHCFCNMCGGDDMTFDVICPACGTEIELDEADLSEDSINCPQCNELLEFEFEDDEEDDENKEHVETTE